MPPGSRCILAPAISCSLSFSNARRGKRLTTYGIQRILRVLSGQIGTRVRAHRLRHTAITAALDVAAAHGLSIDLVRQFSRHKSINTLLVYRDDHQNKQGEMAGWVADHVSPGDDVAVKAGSASYDEGGVHRS